MLRTAQRVEKVFSPRWASFQNFIKVLKTKDFNGAGKQAKRRRWRIKRGCFEEGSQSADIKYPLIGLSRRCIPSWVISAPRAAFGGCAPKHACGRSPAHTLHPQGVYGIRKAAEPLTAALPYRCGEFTTLLTVSDSIFLPILRQESRYFNSLSAKPPEILRSGILSARTRLSSC